MKITPAIILDTLFTAFISFILLFILTNYYMPRLSAIALSITLALIFALLSFKMLSNKHKKENSLCSAASVIFIIISHFISLIFYLFLIKKYLRHEYENIFSRKESSFFYVTNQANYFFTFIKK